MTTQLFVDPDDTEIEDSLGDDSDEVIPYKYTITSYGADYDVDGIVRRLKNKDIIVPQFQRGYVWTYRQASRFIETLLLGLPVPGIFLSKETASQKLLVIDGQQRLMTLLYFYTGVFEPTEKKFKLAGVQKQLIGQSIESLGDEDRRRLNDSILHATVVKQDAPSEDDSSIYHIFERLNTGGTQLLPQEIRACIYHGSFNDLLRELNSDAHWRNVFGKLNRNMRDQELILRFLAFYFEADKYESPMKEFLNKFMGRHRDINGTEAREYAKVFQAAIATIDQAIGAKAFRPVRALNAAVLDSVMAGIATRLIAGGKLTPKEVSKAYDTLLKNKDYMEAVSTGTSQEEKVKTRLRLAREAFEKL